MPGLRAWSKAKEKERNQRFAALFVSVLAGAGCFWLVAFNGPSSAPVELGRISSPDGALELVISEIPANATVSAPYRVSIVLRDRNPTADDLVLSADRSDKPLAGWIGNDGVSLRCNRARVWSFRNFWVARLPEGTFRSVSVMLECGEKGFAPDTPRP